MSVRKWGDKVPHVKWDERAQEDAWYFGEARVFSASFSAHAGWTEYFPDTPKRLSDVSPALWRVVQISQGRGLAIETHRSAADWDKGRLGAGGRGDAYPGLDTEFLR